MTNAQGKRRGWLGSVIFAAVLATAAVIFRSELRAWLTGTPGAGATSASASRADAASPASSSPRDVDHYTCSMHPSVTQNIPGKCPICGMDLIPVATEREPSVVVIESDRRQLIGVRTGPVVQAPLQRSLRALGQVVYDESAITEVSLKVHGWISKLFVNQTGQKVTRGQPLLSLYSPDLFSAEQDFLLANQGAAVGGAAASPGSRMEMLGRAARQRLHLLGLTDAQIDEIAKRGAPAETITISSPASGFVIEKNVVDGAAVDAGARLYRIAALDRVWVEAEVYEADLAHVRVGQSAKVTLDYLPGQTYQAKIASIYPSLEPSSRTGRVRIELGNKKLELRPGMYVNVMLESEPVPRVQVPVAAVVYTGPRRLVFVDLGDGRFRIQEVQVGSEANGMYEVLSGVSPGDSVAISGVFLIAAEARISTAAKYWDKAADEPERPAPAPLPSAEPPSARGASRPGPSVVYGCPMHPEVRRGSPGKCPVCGMDLEPKPVGGK